MQCSSIKKVVGGKTVKVDLEVSGKTIVNVVVSGDFFLYPEDAIHEIESSIRGKTVEEAIMELDKFRSSVEFLGITMDDLIQVIIDAYKSCSGG